MSRALHLIVLAAVVSTIYATAAPVAAPRDPAPAEYPPGTIVTIAGGGEIALERGEGKPATEVWLAHVGGIALGPEGRLYLTAPDLSLVVKIDAAGMIRTVGGNGEAGYSGDGGPATEAALNQPVDVAVGADGSVYIADARNRRVRKVSPEGVITTIAGTGEGGWAGDGGPASKAQLSQPAGLALGPDGTLYIADSSEHRVRKVAPDGTISTVAGSGSERHSGDYGPATKAGIRRPTGVAVGAEGSLYIAEASTGCIRRLDRHGVITTVAGEIGGMGGWAYYGDGGRATIAGLRFPEDVAPGPDGCLYIADTENNRIRRVDRWGIISTVVGDGWSTVGGCTGRFAGDGGPAVEASLSWPVSVAVAEDGTIYLADRLNCRIRKITPGPPSQRPRDARIVLQGRLGMGMTAEAIAELERIVRQRAKALGLKDLSVRNEGDTLIVVTFRPVRAFGHVVRALSARGNLDFRSVPDKYQPVIEPSRILLRGPDHKSVPAEEALKDREPIVKREDLLTKASTSVDPDTGQPVLRVYLSDAAEQAVALWFQQHRKSYLAVVFDGRVISVAQLPSAIRQYANVAGIFRSAEAQTIVACLKTDPLPIKVIVREQRRGVVSHGE